MPASASWITSTVSRKARRSRRWQTGGAAWCPLSRKYVQKNVQNILSAATPPDILTRMMNVATSPANQQKVARAAQLLQELLERSLKRGFHGTAELVLSVQDGTIQHIRCRVEQIDK